MSEQYYYLLDGKEHGPFSRAAIESLLQSGKLAGAFLRADKDQPWQAPEEIGLVASKPPVMPVVASGSNNPAVVVFRSAQEIERSKSGGMGGPMLAIGLFALLIGGGVWLTVKHQPIGSAGAGADSKNTNADADDNVAMVHAAQAAVDRAESIGRLATLKPAELSDEQKEAEVDRLRDAIAKGAVTKKAAFCDEFREVLIGKPPSSSFCRQHYDGAAYHIGLYCKQMERLIDELPRRPSWVSPEAYGRAIDGNIAGAEDRADQHLTLMARIGCLK